jgi:hypothetical protein
MQEVSTSEIQDSFWCTGITTKAITLTPFKFESDSIVNQLNIHTDDSMSEQGVC